MGWPLGRSGKCLFRRNWPMGGGWSEGRMGAEGCPGWGLDVGGAELFDAADLGPGEGDAGDDEDGADAAGGDGGHGAEDGAEEIFSPLSGEAGFEFTEFVGS